MWDLVAIPTDRAVPMLDDVIGKKTVTLQGRLKVLRPKLLRVYQDFDEHRKLNHLRGLPKTFQPHVSTKQIRQDLHHLYERTQARLNIQRDILNHQPAHRRNRCSYCGVNEAQWEDEEDSVRGQTDHVLPRSIDEYPELSVHPQNLAPACGPCNRFKGTAWKDIWLPYYDSLATIKPFLKVTIEPSASMSMVEYSFEPSRHLSPGTRIRLQHHLKKLRLLQRWNIIAAAELKTLSTLWKRRRHRTRHPLDVRDLVAENKDEAKVLEDQYGRHYWKTALFCTLGCYNLIDELTRSPT